MTTVRELIIDDIEPLTQLWRDYFIELNQNNFIEDNVNEIAKRIVTSLIKNKVPTLIVIDNKGNYAGFATLENIKEKTIVSNIYVRKESRNKGYGKILLNYIEKMLREMRRTRGQLEAYVINKNSLKFFTNCGFSEKERNIVVKQVWK